MFDAGGAGVRGRGILGVLPECGVGAGDLLFELNGTGIDFSRLGTR